MAFSFDFLNLIAMTFLIICLIIFILNVWLIRNDAKFHLAKGESTEKVTADATVMLLISLIPIIQVIICIIGLLVLINRNLSDTWLLKLLRIKE